MCVQVADCIPLGVKDTVLLEDLSNDRDSRVDRVGDDKDKCLGGSLCDTSGKISDDTGVDLVTN